MPDPQFLRRLFAQGILRPEREGRRVLSPRSEADAWVAMKIGEWPPVDAATP